MVTTSPDSLFSPDDANQYNLTVDMAAMQTSVQSALNNRTRRYTATTVAALPTSGVPTGATGWTTTDQVDCTYTGSKWVVTGGLLPAVNLALPTCNAVNGSIVPVTWGGALISPSPSSMWSSGSADVRAPLTGLYQMDLMLRWADTANVEVSIRRNNVEIPSAQKQYSLRNTNVTGLVQMTANDTFRIGVQSYSGNQSPSNGFLSFSFVRSL